MEFSSDLEGGAKVPSVLEAPDQAMLSQTNKSTQFEHRNIYHRSEDTLSRILRW